MDNKEPEKVKLDMEELDEVAGGVEGPAYRALKEYWAELSEKYNAPKGAVPTFFLTREEKEFFSDRECTQPFDDVYVHEDLVLYALSE